MTDHQRKGLILVLKMLKGIEKIIQGILDPKESKEAPAPPEGVWPEMMP